MQSTNLFPRVLSGVLRLSGALTGFLLRPVSLVDDVGSFGDSGTLRAGLAPGLMLRSFRTS